MNNQEFENFPEEELVEEPISDEESDPFELVSKEELKEKIRDALKSLEEIDQKIIALRYGFDGDEKSFEEIGKEVGLSRDRVRQRWLKALRLLKKEDLASKNHPLESFLDPHYLQNYISADEYSFLTRHPELHEDEFWIGNMKLDEPTDRLKWKKFRLGEVPYVGEQPMRKEDIGNYRPIFVDRKEYIEHLKSLHKKQSE
jgi:hypothetical protein